MPFETHRDPLDLHHQPYGQLDQIQDRQRRHYLGATNIISSRLEKRYVAVMTSANKKWLIALNPLLDHLIINPPHRHRTILEGLD